MDDFGSDAAENLRGSVPTDVGKVGHRLATEGQPDSAVEFGPSGRSCGLRGENGWEAFAEDRSRTADGSAPEAARRNPEDDASVVPREIGDGPDVPAADAVRVSLATRAGGDWLPAPGRDDDDVIGGDRSVRDNQPARQKERECGGHCGNRQLLNSPCEGDIPFQRRAIIANAEEPL